MIGPGPKARRNHPLLTGDSPADRELLAGQKLSKQIISKEHGARTLGMNRWILCNDSIRTIREVGATPAPSDSEAADKVDDG